MNKISIKFTVVSLFLFLASLIVISMFYVQYIFSQELIHRSMNDQIKLLSSKVEDNINSMDNINSNIVTNGSSFLQDISREDFLENKTKYHKIFTNILENNKNLYAVYVGLEDDSFFELINLNIDQKLRKQYNANNNERWLYIEIIDKKRQLILLDNALIETSKRLSASDYLPTTRPWYKKALLEKEVIKTKPYNFSNIDGKGVTFAKNILSSNNVFALDLLTSNLNVILRKFSSNTLENAYIFDKEGKILASSSDDGKSFMLEHFKNQIQNKKIDNPLLQEIEIEDKKYIYSITPLKDDFLCTYSDAKKIIEPYSDKIYNMIFFMLIIIISIIPIIFYFSSIIVKPISLLMKESIKVKNRAFTKVKKIDSRVLEIDQLSAALSNMSESISEYQIDLETKVLQRTLQLKEKNKELQKLSITDKLTGLYNRIKLDDTLELSMQQVNRYNKIFGIIIIDIDFFKSVNDTFGHQVGDIVLVEFATLIKKSVRESDIVGRWGGEEFMIICPETNLESMLVFANKLREKIALFNFSFIKHKTASFGLSTYKKGETLEKMINRADQALYLAKEEGRNKVKTIEIYFGGNEIVKEAPLV